MGQVELAESDGIGNGNRSETENQMPAGLGSRLPASFALIVGWLSKIMGTLWTKVPIFFPESL